MATRRAFILAGTGSGCGKTTVTLGLLSLLQQRGMRVQPCKVGPDYLDTAWHTAISGIASRNLDSFMLPAPILNALFTEQLQQADIAGVIVNRVNSDAHFQLLKSAIERYCQVPVLGYVPRVEGVALPERHLGLVTARESVVNQQAWRDFASLLGRTLDIDRLLALSELAAMPIGEWGEQLAADAGEGLTLALADDEAFNFYYPDNLALLARCGVKMVRFSPLRDRQLPACQMIWLGGGYPELHAAGLSANHEMLTQLRAAHRRGVAIYAECGGLMYLGTTLEVTSGERYTMADIIPGHSRMGTRLTRFGYCEAQAQQQTLLAAPGEWLRGHEFHYSDFSPATPAVLACRKQRDGKTLQQWQGGWQSGSAFASYLHVHFAQRPTMLNHWLRAARRAL